jgi:hypothetical protein
VAYKGAQYVEILSDGGIIGAILLLSFVGFTIYSAIQTGNYILLGGLACLMLHGTVFYTLSTFSYVPYIVLAACVSSQIVTPYHIPMAISIIIVLALIRLVIDYVIKPQLSLYWITKCIMAPRVIQNKLNPLMIRRRTLEERKKHGVPEHEEVEINYDLRKIGEKIQGSIFESIDLQNQYIDKAVSLTPCDGSAIGTAAKVKAQTDPWLGLHYMERAIHLFDGIMKLPETWAMYGEMQKMTGNWEGAKRSFKYSLHLNPRLYQVRDMLKEMTKSEEDLILRNKQIENTIHPVEAKK